MLVALGRKASVIRKILQHSPVSGNGPCISASLSTINVSHFVYLSLPGPWTPLFFVLRSSSLTAFGGTCLYHHPASFFAPPPPGSVLHYTRHDGAFCAPCPLPQNLIPVTETARQAPIHQSANGFLNDMDIHSSDDNPTQRKSCVLSTQAFRTLLPSRHSLPHYHYHYHLRPPGP